MLRTYQPEIRKNLRTSQPQKKFTGPYKKKRVYLVSGCSEIKNVTYRPTDRPMDGPTKWGVESRSTRLETFRKKCFESETL